MKKSILCCLMACAVLVCAASVPKESLAVPSFAKQTGRPCSGCHTIWPRLNTTGREFKLLGYTEVADDYPRIDQDNLDLLRFGPPLAVSIISFPYQNTTGPNRSIVGSGGQTRLPDEFALYFAGRLTSNIGVFSTPHWLRSSGAFTLELVKMAAATRAGESNIIGIVAGKMDVAGADPYNTIRYTAFHTINSPAILSKTRASGDFFSFSDNANQGVVVNGKFFQTLYLALGGFRGDSGSAQVESDPIDVFGRAVFEYPLGEAIASIGGFVYDGKERYDHSFTQTSAPAGGGPVFTESISLNQYATKIRRTGFDLQYQLESDPHLIEVIGTYMAGRDTNVDQFTGAAASGTGTSEIKFTGYYAEASYFYQRMYGITLGYDHLKSDQDDTLNKKGPTLNVTYSPWLNTKFGLEFSEFDIIDPSTDTKAKERDTFLVVHLYF